jgi:O-antigen/teichoic acid export membrane protein
MPFISLVQGVRSKVANFAAQKIIVAVGWSAVSQMLGRICGFTSSILLARVMGVEEFGQNALLMTTLIVFQSVSLLGLGTTVTKFVAEFMQGSSAQVGRTIIFCLGFAVFAGLILSLMILIFASLISEFMIGNLSIKSPLAISSISIIFLNINAVAQGAIAGLQNFKNLAYINFFTGLISLLILPAGAYLFSLDGVAVGFLLLQIVAASLSVLSLIQICRERNVVLKISLNDIGALYKKLFLKFSIPTAMLGFVIWPTQWLCSAMLAKGDLQSVAIYYAATQLASAVLLVIEAFGQAILPYFASRSQIGEKFLIKVTFLSALISLPMILVITFISSWLMGLFGRAYSNSSETLIILLAGAFVVLVQTSATKYLQAKNVVTPLFYISLLWAASQILIFLFLIDFGANGLAIARLISYLINGFAIFILVRKSFNKKFG